HGYLASPYADAHHDEMSHERLDAYPQRLAQTPGLRQCAPDVVRQLRQAGWFEKSLPGPAALAAHLGVAQLPLDGGDQTPEISLGEKVLRTGLHRLDRDVLADRARDEDEGRIEIARSQQGQGRRPAERRHAVVADHQIPPMP